MAERAGADVDFKASFMAADEKGPAVEPGDVVSGIVIQLTDEDVIVDVGLKCEGRIKKSEFEALGETVSVGDTIEVKVLSLETEEGTTRLSRQRAAQDERWTRVQNAFKNQELIEGKVVGEIKGGFKVDIGLPYTCFLPKSQATLKRRATLEDVQGETLMFEIKEMDRRRKNIVLSRKTLLEGERDKVRVETLSKISVGNIIEGTVKNITTFGVFVDIGGIDGLITLGDLSWSGFVKEAGTIVKKGDVVNVKVLEFDPNVEPAKIRLGLKQAQGDPWDSIAEACKAGSLIEGTVKSFTNFGAFIEIKPGIDGLAHISELSWTNHVKHPSQVLELGAKTLAKVLAVSAEKRKISLSIKQAAPDPWSQVFDEFPPGARVKGVITGVTNFGAFFKLPSGIEGMIHRTDLTWDENPPDPQTILKPGDEVEVIVLRIDAEEKKISLGLKQTLQDPWNEVARMYQKNKIIETEITRLTPEGAIVQLDDKLEGFIPLSDLSREKIHRPEEVVTVGQKVRAKVTKLERKGARVLLSIRDLMKEEEAHSVKTYMNDQEKSGSITLGDMIGNSQLAEQLKELVAKHSS
ncbi:MAG: 30S ribosomal protein S1 [Candidatus Hydrogenedentota bacterium]